MNIGAPATSRRLSWSAPCGSPDNLRVSLEEVAINHPNVALNSTPRSVLSAARKVSPIAGGSVQSCVGALESAEAARPNRDPRIEGQKPRFWVF